MFDRISETFRFFAGHWWAIGVVVWLFAFPTLLMDLLITPPEPGLDGQPDFSGDYYKYTFGLMLILTPLSNVVLPLKLRSILDQQSRPLGMLIQQGLGLWLKSFMTLFLMGIALFFGFMLFILPGIYLMARMVYAPFYVAFEAAGPVDAIKRSMDATREDHWSLLGVLLFFWSVVLLIHLMLSGMAGDMRQIAVVLQFTIAPLTALVTIAALRFFDLHHATYQRPPNE